MKPTYPPEKTQMGRVLKVLLDANGDWINYQYFVRTMFLTQAHAVIWGLENKHCWKIEHSSFTDDFGFKSYRILPEAQPKLF